MGFITHVMNTTETGHVGMKVITLSTRVENPLTTTAAAAANTLYCCCCDDIWHSYLNKRYSTFFFFRFFLANSKQINPTSMVVSSTPFSAVLHQLLSTTKPTSSKGKGKARSQPSDFLTRPIESNQNEDWNESVKAFCSLVEKHSANNNANKSE